MTNKGEIIMYDLEIIIKGEAGSGKSTLAAVITKHLRENNIEVDVKDEGIQDVSKFIDRLHNIDNIKGHKVKIVTQQAVKE